MDTKASNLLSSAFSLQVIHKGAAKLQHAIRQNDGEKWEPYFPNHFIYAFFAFNSLYNVDWSASYSKGHIVPIPKRQFTKDGRLVMVEEEEGVKQFKYLSFCFRDQQFVRLYKEFFIQCVLKGDTKEDVKDMLSEIRLDQLPNGSIRTENYVRKFKMAVDDLLSRGLFNKDTVEIILKYIYSVRCNIFHGVKSIKEMTDYDQQNRLDIYASVLIALNQMVFSYLDYLKGEAIKDSFDELYEELM